jgi:hypothetical protein
MIHDDKVVGLPLVAFKNTKALIEAITESQTGMVAFATDTEELGFKKGSAWEWLSIAATGGVSLLDQLLDVSVPAPNDRDVLTYDLAVGQWIAAPGHVTWGNVLVVAKSGGDYTSIQTAINAASAGDVILIMPGDYTEDITLADDVHLMGIAPYQESIQGKPPVQILGQVTSDTSAYCVIANLAIYHADNTASDIHALGKTVGSGYLEMHSVNITCLNSGAGEARGIYIGVNATMALHKCWIDSDDTSGTATGAYIELGNGEFFHCVFGGNQDADLFVGTGAHAYLICTRYRPDTVSGSGSFHYDDADPIATALVSTTLPSNWDAEVKLTGTQLESDITTGTPPLIVASTTKVSNLNADTTDDLHATSTPGNSEIVATDASGFVKLPATAQIVGAGSPAAGSGIELFWTGAYAGVLGYNRSSPAYLPVRVIGSQVNIYEGTTSMVEVNGGQVGIAGSPDDILTVTTSTVAKGAHVGSAWIGNWNGGATYAVFAHNSVKGATGSYAVLQSSGGTTYINSASGADLYFRINNATVFSWVTANVALQIAGTGDIRVGGGLYVGSTGTNPATGDVIATADGRLGGGLYVGSTATNPATGEVRATAFVSGYLPLSDYSGSGMTGLTATTTIAACSLGKDTTLKSMYVTAYVATTNNGSNYWTIALKDAGAATLASVNTSGGSAGAWTSYSTTGLSVSLTIASNDKFLYVEVSKTGSPGALSLGCPSCFVT